MGIEDGDANKASCVSLHFIHPEAPSISRLYASCPSVASVRGIGTFCHSVTRMTVVETKNTVPEETVRKKIAKQYRKRRDKRAFFFVAGRPWPGVYAFNIVLI